MSALPSPVARAASPAQVNEAPSDRMIALNRKALVDIQGQHYHAAQYWLEEALVISETAGLANQEVTARTYVNLAAIAMAANRDREEALRCLTLALRINPNIAITPGLEIAGLRSAYLQARQQEGLPPNPDPTSPSYDAALAAGWPAAGPETGEPADTGKPDNSPPPQPAQVRSSYGIALLKEPDLPARVPSPLYCQVASERLPGQDLVIRCLTQRYPRKSSAVFHYRSEGAQTPFLELPLDRTPKGWLAAVLPGSELPGQAISYYITAYLPGSDQPLHLAYPEAPRALAMRNDVGPLANTAEDTTKGLRKTGSLWFAVGGGFAAAYHGTTTTDDTVITSGLAPASLFQLEPELGFQINKRLSLSLMGRYQYVPASSYSQTTEAPSSSALAVFLHAKLYFVTAGNLQLYAAGGAGLGHFLAVAEHKCDGADCSSDLASGSVALAATLGMLYHLSPRFGLFTEVKEIVSLPKTMALTELSVGFAVALPLRNS
ncbi:MAG: tetratricopeptide repeat protein [Polyangia bacterium]